MMEQLNKLTPVLTHISQTTQIEDVNLTKLINFKFFSDLQEYDEF